MRHLGGFGAKVNRVSASKRALAPESNVLGQQGQFLA